MKIKSNLLVVAALVSCVSLSVSAQTPQPEPTHERFGKEKPVNDMNLVYIQNNQGESLGRIKDLAIDLINGRIVEVLVVSGDFLGMGGKVVAVPPLALTADATAGVYRLNVSKEKFKAAPAIDRSEWVDTGRSKRIATAYRYFGQEPYFLEEGDTASRTASRPMVSLGHVERSVKIVGMPVGNYQGEHFGKVRSLTLDILKGRILYVTVLAPDTSKTESVVPAMALSFNSVRDRLLIDDTKEEFTNEPRLVATEAAFGHKGHYKRESYQGPHTLVALEQGHNSRDADRTALINKNIRASKIDVGNLDVGTMYGRVTLRGSVNTEADKLSIGEIACAASRLELVDNQITVNGPVLTK